MATELVTRKPLALGRDTGPAKLPALPAVSTGNASLDAWVRAATERLEVREGSRGNAAEKVVTQRDLREISLVVDALKDTKEAGIGEVKLELGSGLSATLAIKKFEDLIRATKLYQDLKKRLDDPSRFDDLPEAIRDYVTRSVADEASERGTAITRVERIINERFTSMAVKVDTMTAALDEASAGIRDTAWVVAESNFAQAGKLTQLEASLGNYYQDGTPGRANLEQQMTVTADRVAGLRAQYTLKVMAGGALAGYGLSATEVNGVPSSAFIIAADKFAIVNPLTYSGGLTNTPDMAHIPFGVDANGIYLNHNVYVKGTMRIDGGTRTLADGLRGSVDVDGGNGAWSDAVARQAVATRLGKGTVTDNRHLTIGDQVRIGNTVRQWNGSAWINPGITLNGDLLVNGSVSASKINSAGLEVKDIYGNTILGTWTNLDVNRINGLGALGKQDFAWFNNIKWSNGNFANENQIVRDGNPIAWHNISTFIAGAAIGTAYIANGAIKNAQIDTAAVNTMSIAGGSVTTTSFMPGGGRTIPASGEVLGGEVWIDMGPNPPSGGRSGVYVNATFSWTSTGGDASFYARLHRIRDNAQIGFVWGSVRNGWWTASSVCGFDGSPVAGGNGYRLVFQNPAGGAGGGRAGSADFIGITATGGKR